MMPSPAFWRGRRVLVTGHTGFKGSWLTLLLGELGAQVTGLSAGPVGDPSLHEVAAVPDALAASVTGDVRDTAAIRRAVAAARPEVVLHLAAQALVGRAYEDPLETFTTNVAGTASVLDAVRHAGTVRAAVVVTSDKVYENERSGRPFREDDRLGGRDPYSASKAAAEIVTAAYRRSFLAAGGVATATARAGNVIGGGDRAPGRLVPDTMAAALAGTPVRLRNPGSRRPWQHVLDPLAGYLLLAERLAAGDLTGTAFNFGPPEPEPPTAAEVVERLAALWGGGLRWEDAHDAAAPAEAADLRLDSSLAAATLGWRPRWGLDEALTRVAGWYRAYAAGDDMGRVSRREVRDFLR
jgi:CDP-glucose 4,6-dehydratase